MRLSGYFVSVATLGFLIIVNVVLINAVDFTRGARTFTGVPLETTLAWAVGWLVLTLVILARIVYSPLGRRYRAVREDTIAARAVGIKVLPTRLSAFALGAFFAGVGGSLYGHYLGSFSPASFYMAYTFALISMLVIGGMQSLSGAVLGVVLVTVLSEILRNLERGLDLGAFVMPPLYGASQIVLGIIFILIMIFRPSGLMGDSEVSLARIVKRLQQTNRGMTAMKTTTAFLGLAFAAGLHCLRRTGRGHDQDRRALQRHRRALLARRAGAERRQAQGQGDQRRRRRPRQEDRAGRLRHQDRPDRDRERRQPADQPGQGPRRPRLHQFRTRCSRSGRSSSRPASPS